MQRALAIALSLLALAAPAREPTWVKPSGEVHLHRTSVRFDTDTVEGPTVRVQRRPDGSWGGTLFGQPVDVRVDGARLAGSELKGELRREKDRLKLEGLWRGTRFRYELTPERLVVRFGSAGADYLRHPDGRLEPLSIAQGRGGRLTGEAATLDAPLPQLLLALLATGEPGGIGGL